MVGTVIDSFTFAAPTATATSTATATATATATISGPNIILVQQAVATGAGHNNITATFGAPTTVGNVIIACVDYSDSDPVTNVDSPIDALIQQTESTGTGIATAIWSVVVSGAETNHKIYKAGDILRATVWFSEWSGLTESVSDADAVNGNTGLASSTVTTNSVTPLSANNLIIACGGWTADDYSTGPTNSFTRATAAGGGSVWLESAYKLQTSATAASTGWTLTAGINWATAIASFGAP